MSNSTRSYTLPVPGRISLVELMLLKSLDSKKPMSSMTGNVRNGFDGSDALSLLVALYLKSSSISVFN